MSDEIVNKNTATVLVAGALLGSGIALIFAPQSGRQTRRKIRHFTETIGDKAQSTRRQWQHSLENVIEDTEKRVQRGLTSGMEWSESKLGELQKTLKTARKSIGGKPGRNARAGDTPKHSHVNGHRA